MNKTIKETENYEKFEPMPFNRDVKRTKYLEDSMRRFGWLDPYPMHVTYNGRGKFLIKAGQHRFEVAKKLGIPVKYIICNDESKVYELEKATTKWNMNDYLTAFVRSGKPGYFTVKEYHRETGISLQCCISMLAGQSAGSGNMAERFKSGTYRLGNPEHASTVADVVLHAKRCGISWATITPFVRAVSRIAWVEEFDSNLLKQKISTFSYLIEKQPSVDAYIDMLDSIYNRQSRTRLPLKFLSDEMARKRNLAFTQKNKFNSNNND